MFRLKLLFAVALFLMALPLWRLMDTLVWIWPGQYLYAIVFFLWGLFFITLPLWLLKPRLLPLISLVIIISLSLLSWGTGPLSDQATLKPDLNHCGRMTFTGLLYPIHTVTTQALADDLEVRNQICWVRKMTSRMPRSFDSVEERDAYLYLVQEKLLRPEFKYRATLPMIAVLNAMALSRVNDNEVIFNGERFIEGLKFWINQYTVEISAREYNFWDWPYSQYIKFEYGLIEKNWEKIINSLVIEG
jgi:hypothetical protein